MPKVPGHGPASLRPMPDGSVRAYLRGEDVSNDCVDAQWRWNNGQPTITMTFYAGPFTPVPVDEPTAPGGDGGE